MKKIENHCCDCAVPGYPCIGNACPNRNVPVFYCDGCEEPIRGEVYEDGDEDLCRYCYHERYEGEE